MKPHIKKVLEPLEFISTFFKIESKEEKIVNFDPNTVQRNYWNEHSNRDLILKSRQQGISSLALGLMLRDMIVTKNCKCVVISHERDATIRLLRRVKFYLDNLKVPIRTEYESQSEITFPDLNSSIYIGTAGQKSFGRGDTINRLHCSEIASWARPEEILTGLLEAVPINGRVIIETTAQGIGTWFYRFLRKIIDGLSNWKLHFFPWFLTEEYRISESVYLEQFKKVLTDLDDEELRLKINNNVTDDQLRWRRWKISEMPDPVFFKQEYPATWEEAFISRLNCVFDVPLIRKLSDQAPPPIIVGIIDKSVKKIQESENGYLSIWKMPIPGHAYVMSADSAAGSEKGDPSCAHVYDASVWEQVAEWHGLIHPDLFAEELNVLGMLYYNALAIVERNSSGIGVLLKLWELSYPNIYTEMRLDKGLQSDSRKLGLFTSSKTKEVMVNRLKALLRKGFKVYSQKTLGEFSTFVYKPSKITENYYRMEADGGAHDDCVMAAALAAFVLHDIPKNIVQPTQEIVPMTLEWFLKKRQPDDRNPLKVGNF